MPVSSRYRPVPCRPAPESITFATARENARAVGEVAERLKAAVC
jgi:hypothetical protein